MVLVEIEVTVVFTELAARRALKFATRLEEAMPIEAAFADATEAAVTATEYVNDARRASVQLLISTLIVSAVESFTASRYAAVASSVQRQHPASTADS